MDTNFSSQQIIKENHLKTVFSLIHELDGISRADIKKLTKMSATTVSALVEELIANGLVTESGMKDASTSGRKAISLSVNASGGYFAVVLISANHLSLCLFDLNFSQILSKRERYDNRLPLSDVLTDFLRQNVFVKDCGELLGITVGIPAIIDANSRAVSSTVLTLLPQDDFYTALSRDFPDIKIAVCNNSVLGAYAETEFGDTDAKSLISVDISDGVGASAIIDGVPFTGSNGMACEFGHISVDMNGKKCRCGSRGCLETLVSMPAISQKASQILGTEICAESLSQYTKDNTALSEYIDTVCKTLAFGINNLINLYDPEAVVISGSILNLGGQVIEKIRTYVWDISLKGRNVLIEASKLGGNAELLGGAKYIFDTLFK